MTGNFIVNSRYSTIVVLLITALFSMAVLVMLPSSSVVVDHSSLVELASTAVMIGFLYGVGMFVRYRLRGDVSQMAMLIRRLADALSVMLRALALFLPLSFVMVIFMYVASATDRPLMDPMFVAIDATLGFNWLNFSTFIDTFPNVAALLVISYHALGYQVPLVFLLFGLIRQEARLLEFLALLAVCSLFTAILMALLPAAGAFAHYQPHQFENFTVQAGMWHYDDLVALRTGEPFILSISEVEGLVTFPSFHTALGILVVYVLRGVTWLVWPIALLNGLMIIATIPEGGHHLIDVIAGATLALLAIALVRYPARRVRQPDVILP